MNYKIPSELAQYNEKKNIEEENDMWQKVMERVCLDDIHLMNDESKGKTAL